MEKDTSSLEKTLKDFSTLKTKQGGTIIIYTCKGDKLSTLLAITGLAKGTHGKLKEEKKQKPHLNNTTNDELTFFSMTVKDNLPR